MIMMTGGFMRKLAAMILVFVLVFSQLSITVSFAALHQGLLGWWRLDEAIGTTAADSSAGGRDAAVHGAQWYSGAYGNSLFFDGIDDYVELPNDAGSSDAGSISLWFKTDQDADPTAHLFYASKTTAGDGGGADDELHLSLRPDGRLQFFIEGGSSDVSLVSSQTYNDNEWHLAVAVWDRSGNAGLYMDGALDKSAVHGAHSFDFSAGKVRLGRPNANSRHYRGLLDEVRLYDKALSSQEIGDLYTGVVGLWRLNESGGATASDSSGANRHAAVHGPIWTSGYSGNALSFDGIDDYVSLPNTGGSTYQGSVAFRFKSGQDVAQAAFMFYASRGTAGDGGGDDPEMHVNLTSSEKLQLFIEGSSLGGTDLSLTSASAYNDDLWHHVVATWDIDGQAKLYIDGVLEKSAAHDAAGFDFTAGAIQLGKPNANTRYYEGLLDQVKLYDRAITELEVKELYAQVGLWQLDDNSGSVAVDSGDDGVPMTVTGASWTGGKAGGALAFDGIDDFASLPAKGSSGAGAISMWVRTDTAFGDAAMLFYAADQTTAGNGFGGENELHLGFDNAGRLQLYINGTSSVNLRSAASYNDGKWHHVAATWDIGGTAALYVDGGSVASAAHSGDLFQFASGNVLLGKTNSGARKYAGLIDHVRYYTAPLDQAQIQALSTELTTSSLPVAVVEAEDGLTSGAVAADAHAGYSGTGYIAYPHNYDDFAQWEVDVPVGGTYNMLIRYANGDTNDRRLVIKANNALLAGETTEGIAFPATAGWTDWCTLQTGVALKAGRNALRFQVNGLGPAPHIDKLYLSLSAADPAPAAPQTRYEAEDVGAYVSGAVIGQAAAGYSGTGYAAFANASDDYVQWAVRAAESGTYSLSFRYANGDAADRPLELKVNGAVLSSGLSFAGTGGWSAWSVADMDVPLQKGYNIIRLTAAGSGGPYVDRLDIAPIAADPPAGDPAPIALPPIIPGAAVYEPGSADVAYGNYDGEAAPQLADYQYFTSAGKLITNTGKYNSWIKLSNVNGGAGGVHELVVTSSARARGEQFWVYVNGRFVREITLEPASISRDFGNADGISFNQHKVLVDLSPGATNEIELRRIHEGAGVDFRRFEIIGHAARWPATSALTAANAAMNSLDLSWTASNNLDFEKYGIFQDDVQIAEVDKAFTSYSVAGLEQATTYTFSVQIDDGAAGWLDGGPSVTAVTYKQGYEAEDAIRVTTGNDLLLPAPTVTDDVYASGGQVLANTSNLGSWLTLGDVDGGSTGGDFYLTIHNSAVQSGITWELYVNEVYQRDVVFHSTGGYGIYGDTHATVTLPPGDGHTITLRHSGGADEVRFDRFDFMPAPPEPDYLADAIRIFDTKMQYYDEDAFMSKLAAENRTTNLVAESAWQLYELTDDVKYLIVALNFFNRTLDYWMNEGGALATGSGFFAAAPMTRVHQGLRSLNLVSPAQESKLLEFYKANATRQDQDDNQGFARAEGTAKVYHMYPSDPNAGQWLSQIEDVWDMFLYKDHWSANYNKKDSNENATGYTGIGLMKLIELAREMGWEAQFDDPDVKKLFERYRDQVLSSGHMAEYGDDYFSEAINHIFVLEYAARYYEDPTFLGAAWKLYQKVEKDFDDNYSAGYFFNDLHTAMNLQNWLDILTELPAVTMKPEQSGERSFVTTRNGYGQTGLTDKLVQKTSNDPDGAAIVTELYGFGSHGHPNDIGALQYYEVGGVPLFHNVTRHNRSASYNNQVALTPPTESFPNVKRALPPGVWHTETLSLKTISPFDADGNIFIDRLTIREARLAGSPDFDLYIDNIRLVGPAGVYLLDACDLPTYWTRGTPVASDRTQGAGSLKFTINSDAVIFLNATGYNATVNLNDYNRIQFDWKYTASSEKERGSTIFRLYAADGVVQDSYAGDIANIPDVDSAAVDNRGEDAYSRIALSGYYTHDTTAERKTVLTREGILVIQDKITPGASAAGYAAGPLWHLYSPPVESGANWFDSRGETNTSYYPTVGSAAVPMVTPNLLAYFDTAAGRTFGGAYNRLQGYTPYTVYAEETLAAGVPVHFVTVLVPHDRHVSGADIASAISVSGSGGTSTVTVPYAGLTVQINSDGTWSVTR